MGALLPGLLGAPPEGAFLRLRLSTGDVAEASVMGGALCALGKGPGGRPLVLETGDVTQVLSPVAPGKIVAIGLNDRLHAEEMKSPLPGEPLMFAKMISAVTGPGAPIVLPPQSARVDFEGELAVVMGERCRNVKAEDAQCVVRGLTCANDVTARDIQMKDGQFTRGKSFDTFCPLGPWIVPGSITQPRQLVTTVNGQVKQNASTSQMIFGIPEIIAAITAVMTLEPGDVILTGTYQGVGPLVAGDVVRVSIEGVGELENPVKG